MTSPDGKQTVYATSGADVVSLTEGLTLPSGYQVRAITAEAVEFDHPAFKATARIDLPPASFQDIR